MSCEKELEGLCDGLTDGGEPYKVKHRGACLYLLLYILERGMLFSIGRKKLTARLWFFHSNCRYNCRTGVFDPLFLAGQILLVCTIWSKLDKWLIFIHLFILRVLFIFKPRHSQWVGFVFS